MNESACAEPSTIDTATLTRALLLLLAVTWVPALGITLAYATPEAEARGSMLVVFAPWHSSTQTYRRVIKARGSLIQTTGVPGVWLVHSEHEGFVAALEREGAWLTLTADALRGLGWSGCFRLREPGAIERD